MRMVLLLLLISTYSTAQHKIIFRAATSTFILDIENNEQMAIDTSLYYNEKLAAVTVTGDSVKCHYTRDGSVVVKVYHISNLEDLPFKPAIAFRYTPKYDSYYKHNFYFRNYRLVCAADGISLLQDDEVLWNSSKTTPFSKVLDKGHSPKNNLLGQYPILSPDGKDFLYTSYRYGFSPSFAKLYEVEMSTGKMQLISKNGYYYYPSYSADGRYILYVGLCSGDFQIYDKKRKANVFDFGFKDAFWLYRDR